MRGPEFQAVLQGVSFTGMQVLRSQRLISLHEKKGPESPENEVKLNPPLCRPLKHSMRVAFAIAGEFCRKRPFP